MKILILDIETSPMTGLIWGLWDQNISYKHIQVEGSVICYAAKWLGEKEVFFDSINKSSKKDMLKSVHKLLSEAEALISFNGINFDVKHLNAQFLLHKMKPPSPFKNIDLLRTAKSRFKFPSNKLDYIAKRLGLGQKTAHEGMELWIKCMAGNKRAWKVMETYNRQDVILTEKAYYKLLPWIRNHPNSNLYHSGRSCPSCASPRLQKRGYSTSAVGTYQKYSCMACGSWSQGKKVIGPKVEIRALA